MGTPKRAGRSAFRVNGLGCAGLFRKPPRAATRAGRGVRLVGGNCQIDLSERSAADPKERLARPFELVATARAQQQLPRGGEGLGADKQRAEFQRLP